MVILAFVPVDPAVDFDVDIIEMVTGELEGVAEVVTLTVDSTIIVVVIELEPSIIVTTRWEVDPLDAIVAAVIAVVAFEEDTSVDPLVDLGVDVAEIVEVLELLVTLKEASEDVALSPMDAPAISDDSPLDGVCENVVVSGITL